MYTSTDFFQSMFTREQFNAILDLFRILGIRSPFLYIHESYKLSFRCIIYLIYTSLSKCNTDSITQLLSASAADTLIQVISPKADTDPCHSPCGTPLPFYRFGFMLVFKL